MTEFLRELRMTIDSIIALLDRVNNQPINLEVSWNGEPVVLPPVGEEVVPPTEGQI